MAVENSIILSFLTVEISSKSDPMRTGSKKAPASPSLKTRLPLLDHATTVDTYFDTLAVWLEWEAEAERERMVRRRQVRDQTHVERTGETLVHMDLLDHNTGLAGRLILDFGKPGERPLPQNRLKVGSPVVVSDDSQPSDKGVPGVVSARRTHRIQVAVDVWPEGDRFRIDLSPDETTRRRQVAAMARARDASGRAKTLRDVLMGTRPLRFADPVDVDFLTDLNPPQQDAVRFALRQRRRHHPRTAGDRKNHHTRRDRLPMRPAGRAGAGVRVEQYRRRQSFGTVGRHDAACLASRAPCPSVRSTPWPHAR